MFEARGGPLHTRTLSVTFRQAEPPLVAFESYVLDLRKRGFAPVGGDLQPTGIVHHMQVDGTIDTQTGRIQTVASRMPAVAFEARPATGGDTCRNVNGRTALLEGVRVDDAFARSVGAVIGGPRGCSHLFTLTLLLGPTLRWAFASGTAAAQRDAGWRPGERLFRRDITIDGYELPSTDLVFTAQSNDLWCRPASPNATPMDHFERQLELRVMLQASFEKMVIQAAEAEERRRGHDEFLQAGWTARTDRVAGLVGQSMRHGITQTLLAEFADAGADAPLLDTLLQIPPTSIQCYAALDFLSQRMAETAAAETGGWPDSCYMWRRDGHMISGRASAKP